MRVCVTISHYLIVELNSSIEDGLGLGIGDRILIKEMSPFQGRTFTHLSILHLSWSKRLPPFSSLFFHAVGGEPGIFCLLSSIFPPQALLTSAIYYTCITFPPQEHHVPYLDISKTVLVQGALLYMSLFIVIFLKCVCWRISCDKIICCILTTVSHRHCNNNCCEGSDVAYATCFALGNLAYNEPSVCVFFVSLEQYQ